MSQSLPRRRWQFRLRTLLLLMLWGGTCAVAYRFGLDAGRRPRPSAPVSSQFAKVYYVADLLSGAAESEAAAAGGRLKSQVETNVLPQSWKSQGGEAQIRAFDTNRSLVVDHDPQGHEKVAAFLETLRAEQSSETATTR